MHISWLKNMINQTRYWVELFRLPEICHSCQFIPCMVTDNFRYIFVSSWICHLLPWEGPYMTSLERAQLMSSDINFKLKL